MVGAVHMDQAHTEAGASAGEEVADFRTTRWSMVLEARQDESSGAAAALEQLCRTYWYPLCVFVRRQGHAAHDAQDLTQEFFARLFRLGSLKEVAPSKGKFRTFLLVSLKHFLADAWDAAKAEKRGGNRTLVLLDDENAEERYQLEPARDLSPDVAFDRRWVLTVLEQALARLRQETAIAGKLPATHRASGRHAAAPGLAAHGWLIQQPQILRRLGIAGAHAERPAE